MGRVELRQISRVRVSRVIVFKSTLVFPEKYFLLIQCCFIVIVTFIIVYKIVF